MKQVTDSKSSAAAAKTWPRPSSVSIKLLEMKMECEAPGRGPSQRLFNQPSTRLWCSFQFGNHWPSKVIFLSSFLNTSLNSPMASLPSSSISLSQISTFPHHIQWIRFTKITYTKRLQKEHKTLLRTPCTVIRYSQRKRGKQTGQVHLPMCYCHLRTDPGMDGCTYSWQQRLRINQFIK